jgi:MFS family permease
MDISISGTSTFSDSSSCSEERLHEEEMKTDQNYCFYFAVTVMMATTFQIGVNFAEQN